MILLSKAASLQHFSETQTLEYTVLPSRSFLSVAVLLQSYLKPAVLVLPGFTFIMILPHNHIPYILFVAFLELTFWLSFFCCFCMTFFFPSPDKFLDKLHPNCLFWRCWASYFGIALLGSIGSSFLMVVHFLLPLWTFKWWVVVKMTWDWSVAILQQHPLLCECVWTSVQAPRLLLSA